MLLDNTQAPSKDKPKKLSQQDQRCFTKLANKISLPAQQESILQHTFAVLDQRLSGNLKRLLSLWSQSHPDQFPTAEHTLCNSKVCSTVDELEIARGDKNAFPCLPSSHRSATASFQPLLASGAAVSLSRINLSDISNDKKRYQKVIKKYFGKRAKANTLSASARRRKNLRTEFQENLASLPLFNPRIELKPIARQHFHFPCPSGKLSSNTFSADSASICKPSSTKEDIRLTLSQLAEPLCNETMTSARQQSKQISQSMERSMRVTERRSFANLPTSFTAPVANTERGSISRKNPQLRNSKSFHGDAGMSEVSKRIAVTRRQSSLNASLGSDNGTSARQPLNKKTLERQRTKVLKPLAIGKSGSNFNKLCELGQDFSSFILPESGTSSYRLTRDVSFDEGSRYKGTICNAFSSFKTQIDEPRNGTVQRRIAYAGPDEQRALPSNGRLEKLSDSSNRDRHASGVHAQMTLFKESSAASFIKIEERRPLSRSGNNVAISVGQTGNNNSSVRMSRDPRHSWNQRVGDLSVSGGGYYGSIPMQPGGRVDLSGLVSLSISPASTFAPKMPQSRDKSAISMKSRISSRYGNRYEGSSSYSSYASKEAFYTDPCIGGSASFQQRLTELSLLEADTIKYEKSRKVRRKSRQDKDS